LVPLDATNVDWVELGDGAPCFVASDGRTVLAHDKDVWEVGGSSLVWVKVPVLATGTNELWVYYGGSDTDGCDGAGSAWRDDFRAVFHMNDAEDASSYAHTMLDEGTNDTAGVIGRARAVGVDEAMIGPSDDALRISGDLTITAWVRFSSLSSGTYRNSIVTYGNPEFSEDTNFQYGFYLTSNTNLFSYWAYDGALTASNTSSATTGMPLNEFHHLAMVRDATLEEVRFYYDGAEVGVPQGYDALPTGGDQSFLVVGGNAADAVYNMSGALDELRIAAWAASSDWIAAEYASMTASSPSAVMDP
jgi:hypothetical protein